MVKLPSFLYECDKQPPYAVNILPRYVVSHLEDLRNPEEKHSAIRQKAQPLKFPLTFRDKRDVLIVMKKFSQQSFYSGLAAPQLGILKQIIVFTMQREECKDKCRSKVWLNPSYEQVGDEVTEEYECCVSVKSVTGPLKRYKTIHYKAYNVEGNVLEGEMSGRTARLIQHEIDHLEGKLFTDFIPEEKIVSVRELAQRVLRPQLTIDETDQILNSY